MNNSNHNSDLLSLVKLDKLMKISSGSSKVSIGLIDGFVDLSHSAFDSSSIKIINKNEYDKYLIRSSFSAIHGTFIAGILASKRSSHAPAICPSCNIVIHPIFYGSDKGSNHQNISTIENLSNAIIQMVNSNVNIINLSVGLSNSFQKYQNLEDAYEYARKNGVIIIVASGNQGYSGYVSTVNNRWVIPVAACDRSGKPSINSNFGISIGKRGILSPGINVKSTIPNNKYGYMSGTSVATAFVTGGIALLLSINPDLTAYKIIYLIRKNRIAKNKSIIPSLIDFKEIFDDSINNSSLVTAKF